jgi:hypothetical protein
MASPGEERKMAKELIRETERVKNKKLMEVTSKETSLAVNEGKGEE